MHHAYVLSENRLIVGRRTVSLLRCVLQTTKTDEIVQQAKDELLEALQRSKNELKQSFVQQRAENQRLHELIRALRNENFALQQKQLALQRRLQAVEVELGQ